MPSAFVFLLLIGSCSAIRLREKHAVKDDLVKAGDVADINEFSSYSEDGEVPWQRFCKYDGYGEQNLEDCSTWTRQSGGCEGECMALRDCPYPDPAKPWLHNTNTLFIHPPGSDPDRSCGHLFCCDDASPQGWSACPGTCVAKDDGPPGVDYGGCSMEMLEINQKMDRGCPRGKSCCAQKLLGFPERAAKVKVETSCQSLLVGVDECARNNLDPDGCVRESGCKWDYFHGVCEKDCSGSFKNEMEKGKGGSDQTNADVCNAVPHCTYKFTSYHACHELRARFRRARNCHSDEFWDEHWHTCRPRCDELSQELCEGSAYYSDKCSWNGADEKFLLKQKEYKNATLEAPSLLQNLETFHAAKTASKATQ